MSNEVRLDRLTVAMAGPPSPDKRCCEPAMFTSGFESIPDAGNPPVERVWNDDPESKLVRSAIRCSSSSISQNFKTDATGLETERTGSLQILISQHSGFLRL